jgi:hypothetical protein
MIFAVPALPTMPAFTVAGTFDGKAITPAAKGTRADMVRAALLEFVSYKR